MYKIDKSSDQLRWVILLLAVAVILPTVCLLWFMTQAVKNDRLAIRQRLINTYTKRAEETFFKNPDSYWSTIENDLTAFADSFTGNIRRFPENYLADHHDFSAFVIYDEQGQIIYPVWPKEKAAGAVSDAMRKAWNLEYVEKDIETAIKQYESIAKLSSIPNVVYECRMGQTRCLSKQGKFDDAVKTCSKLAYSGEHIANEYTPEQISNARLMLVSLYSKADHKDLLGELQRQLSGSAKLIIPTETRIFILGELIDLAEVSGFGEELKAEIRIARKTFDSGLMSVMAADSLVSNSALRSQPQGAFGKIAGSQPLYGISFKTGDNHVLGIVTEEALFQFWQKIADHFTDELVFCRVYDDQGQQVAGEPRYFIGQEVVSGAVFSTQKLKKCFTGWKVELYLRAGVFREAADRQRFIYIWVATIVIALMLISTLLASRAVLRQAKLNRLKNDFIATVTHELKTPLSSMRVLADTLLEGNYNDQQQATEYLQLISKENARLSRLIDNFLTFSRMERNKRAFDMGRTSPAEIANAAAEAVRTKFNAGSCEFTVSVDDDLPSILADKDAMITVLVNLLDNAYKYSYDDKRIELKVFSEDDLVCFSVKDNGIGMTRRQTKRVFDRFYQADSSLSRTAEGTGLGLSIVKFIVDAHKGHITVESKPGEGSEFVIKLNTA